MASCVTHMMTSLQRPIYESCCNTYQQITRKQTTEIKETNLLSLLMGRHLLRDHLIPQRLFPICLCRQFFSKMHCLATIQCVSDDRQTDEHNTVT